MEVELVSEEFIKPSSETPAHLRSFKISFIDQLFPDEYIPFINFYPNPNKVAVNFAGLKSSLSDTLTRFYPLAGRIKDQLVIDCNGAGALFLTARHKSCQMAELLTRQPQIEHFDKLLPPFPDSSWASRPLIAIKITLFPCGGLAMGVIFSHKIIDAVTMTAFMKCWAVIAATGSSSSSTIYPDFSPQSIFPGRETPPAPPGGGRFQFAEERGLARVGAGIIKRFVFSPEAISALKAKSTSDLMPNPSRVEAVSAFIWKHAMAASDKVMGLRQPSLFSYTIDLRRRMVPPSPENSLGNVLWKAIAYYDIDSTGGLDLDKLVGSLRAGMRKTRDEVLPKLQEPNGGYEYMINYQSQLRKTCCNKEINSYMITSWCKIGLNEVNFGWGKPIWMGQFGGEIGTGPITNNVTLLDGKTGDEIEAWLILEIKEMEALESDPDFIAYASPNPIVLDGVTPTAT